MSRSIRQRLGARARLLLLVIVLDWLLFVACVFVRSIPGAVMVGAFLAVMTATLALLFALRCPRCRQRLPQVGLAEIWAPPQAVKPAQCPRCGVSLDITA